MAKILQTFSRMRIQRASDVRNMFWHSPTLNALNRFDRAHIVSVHEARFPMIKDSDAILHYPTLSQMVAGHAPTRLPSPPASSTAINLEHSDHDVDGSEPVALPEPSYMRDNESPSPSS
jgi:hypothetical protein